jgi:hypothetical protein
MCSEYYGGNRGSETRQKEEGDVEGRTIWVANHIYEHFRSGKKRAEKKYQRRKPGKKGEKGAGENWSVIHLSESAQY